jgi:uncharacterized protein YjlB
MYAGEAIKRTFERMTGIDRPSQRRALSAVRGRRPQTYLFRDDGKVPNNPTLPLVCYRAVRLSAFSDPAAAFEELFAQHGWEDSWCNGIYDYTHYHSGAHEVLGVARGRCRVRFGGDEGKTLTLAAEDVVILPVGVGHQRLGSTLDLLVVGAYPHGSRYDECEPNAENHARAINTIREVPLPEQDPVYGGNGALLTLWNAHA